MVNSTVLESTDLGQRAGVFQALADRNRLEILDILGHEIRCNCHLQELLDLSPNLLSYHLKVLREAGLIVGKRRGRWIDYSVAPGARHLVEASLPSLEAVNDPVPDREC